MNRTLFARVLLLAVCAMPALAAPPTQVPSNADAGRVQPHVRELVPDRSGDAAVLIPASPVSTEAPKGTDKVHVVLHAVHIEGMTVFTAEQMSDIYAAYLEKDITLDKAWQFAAAVTDRYHQKGYFLSRAYVPEQKVVGGIITLNVIEGYIEEVYADGKVENEVAVKGLVDRLVHEKPLKSDDLESFLLRVNDLPGVGFRGVLSALDDQKTYPGGVKLTLVPEAKANRGSVSFDNFGSRYLGPHEVALSYDMSLLPMQETSVTFLSALPIHELAYEGIDHKIAIAPDLTLEFNGNMTQSHPGDTLKQYDIVSNSVGFGAGINYQWLRQRDMNLDVKAGFDARNTDTDILQQRLVRDRVRALRATVDYDTVDALHGQSTVSATLSQGIPTLGASGPSAAHLSRSEANPDFTKLTVTASRLQGLTDDWSILLAASGQAASQPLYSSEEFGYGGQNFGRAYDTSELTGDNGASAAAELRYDGIDHWQSVHVTPYGFYDMGVVWNYDAGQSPRETGTSAGFGVKVLTNINLAINAGVAFPLNRRVATPIYGGNDKQPRLYGQISQQF